SLKEIEGTIQYVRESVKYVGASEIRVNLFSEIAKQLRLTTKKLVLDVPTRWNSAYHMLYVALKLKAVFPRFAERDSSYKWLPTEEDWVKAENVCEFLHLFSDVTNLISKETLVSSDASMRDMARKMLVKFEKYWGDYGYLESPLEETDEESKFNVLEWWKKERGRYKILSKMACEIMAIPITSVASESAFSTGGRAIDSKRASLGKNTVEALLCSEDWLRDYYSIEVCLCFLLLFYTFSS
ncbi:Zinc finger BED domain-containing protein RICESLEEPER 2, partial [Linum grandiflorum]